MNLVVRATLPRAALASSVEASLRPYVPDLPKGGMQPLTQLVDRAVSPRRFIVVLLAGFAAFALVLASLGIYAVISYAVTRRTQEIGVRMALGASPEGIQGRIVAQTLCLATAGLLIGAAASLGLARALSGLLFGVTYADPFTFAAASIVMLAVALLAGYLPARKASRIDPMAALRAN